MITAMYTKILTHLNLMKALTIKHWPLFIIMGAYWVAVAVLLILSINLNGQLIYPLDDTYIHMSMAKNAVLHHVWGVTKYEFTSTTSSPLWTSLLAIIYMVFGVNVKAPLVLNLIFGTLVILSSYLLVLKYINNLLYTFIILLVAVFVTPLPSLTLSGMEHVLHLLLSLSFVFLSILILSTTKKPPQLYYILLMTLSLLVTTIRYEGVFLVFMVCVLFLMQKKVFYAVALGIIALLPLIIYGCWSIAHGWYFFPNSLLLKGHMPNFDFAGIINLFGYGALCNIKANMHILILLIAALTLLFIYYLNKEKSYDYMKYANIIFVGILLFHMQFASTGWFYRYEAYIIYLGIVVISITTNNLLLKNFVWKINKKTFPFAVVTILLILVIARPFGHRAFESFMVTPQATNNIYEQQYQMGIFLKKFYQGQTITVNDIGAVTYLADIHLVDLYGLASRQPLRLKLQKQYTSKQIYDLTRQKSSSIAIVYDHWFEQNGGLPKQWVRAGQWTISNNIVCGGDTVSLYAINPSVRDDLIKNLRQFAVELPTDVKQNGEYTEK